MRQNRILRDGVERREKDQPMWLDEGDGSISKPIHNKAKTSELPIRKKTIRQIAPFLSKASLII